VLPQDKMEYHRELIAAIEVRTSNKKGRHLSTGEAIRLIYKRGMGGPWWGARRTLINSIDPGNAFRVSLPFSGARQEKRELFRLPNVQA
jgi:hypothetical protein